MSGRQLAEWQIYEQVEPFGERGQYWRTGQMCAAFVNAQRMKKTDPIAKAEDFMPNTFQPEPDEEEPQVDEFAKLKALHDRVRRPR